MDAVNPSTHPPIHPPINPQGAYDIARLAVGGVIAAVDAVVQGRVDNAYCLVRPPGCVRACACVCPSLRSFSLLGAGRRAFPRLA